jgi:hypothetical protein
MMRFVQARVRIQTRVNHHTVDEVVHNCGDAIHAAQPLIESGLILVSHGIAPSFELHEYGASSDLDFSCLPFFGQKTGPGKSQVA